MYGEKKDKVIMKLREAIAAVIPELVEEWNTVKLPKFDDLYEQSFA